LKKTVGEKEEVVLMKTRINEEKILKTIRSNGEFIKEDYRIKGRVLLMIMGIYEEKILKVVRSDGEFIKED
jgi:hypothetical protein